MHVFRLILGLVLGLVLAGGGTAALIAGVRYGLRTGRSDDFWAAVVIGGTLSVVGITIIWLAIRAYRRRSKVDLGEVGTMAAATLVGSNLGEGGDGGGD